MRLNHPSSTAKRFLPRSPGGQVHQQEPSSPAKSITPPRRVPSRGGTRRGALDVARRR
jgi:hypothetical protein